MLDITSLILIYTLQLEVCTFDHIHSILPSQSPASGNQKSDLFSYELFKIYF